MGSLPKEYAPIFRKGFVEDDDDYKGISIKGSILSRSSNPSFKKDLRNPTEFTLSVTDRNDHSDVEISSCWCFWKKKN